MRNKLYSYCLRFDNGAAPNPFWGVCTLVICKPAIRRTVKVGDWIVGLGSTNARHEDMSNMVIYAMKVTRVMTMRDYDAYCAVNLPGKVPKWNSKDLKEKVGDCIYDFSVRGLSRVRPSVHSERAREKDLSGLNAVLSDRFYYFGDKPIPLPNDLISIVHPIRGHKVKANEPFAEKFVSWVTSLGYKRNCLYGEPLLTSELLNDSEKSICDRWDCDDEDDGLIC